MKFVLLLLVSLTFFSVDAKKKTKKHSKHEVAFLAKKHQVNGPFRMPVFAIRMPIFGGQEIVRPSGLELNDEPLDPKEKLKTVTKTHNSTKGPYKTFTVITETKSANKSNPKVFRKIIKSVTTMNRNSPGSNFSLPKMSFSRIRIFNPFKNLGGISFGGSDDKLNDELKEKDCSESKVCKDNDEYCDNFLGVCKKKIVPFGACSQKDQCSTTKGSFQCTWGRCIKGDAGMSGTFCDKETDCHSTQAEELGCVGQNDISHYSKVCVPKLGEGSTCGTSGIFSMFDSDDEGDKRCQGDLVCRTVGFYGRKACVKDISRDQQDYITSIAKTSKTVNQAEAKPKHHHHKH